MPLMDFSVDLVGSYSNIVFILNAANFRANMTFVEESGFEIYLEI